MPLMTRQRGNRQIGNVAMPFNPLGERYEAGVIEGDDCYARITTSSNQAITGHVRHKCNSAQSSGLHNGERCEGVRSAEERGACAS